MKGIKRVVNAIMNAELQNIDNKDYAENIDNYCIVTNIGFFWGKMPISKIEYLKKQSRKFTT